MQWTYEECLKTLAHTQPPSGASLTRRTKAKGSGAHAARVVKMRNKLSGEDLPDSETGLFQDVAQKARRGLEDILQDTIDAAGNYQLGWEASVLDKISQGRDDVLHDFDRRFAVEEAETEENEEAAEEIKAAAVKALQELKDLEKKVEECEDWETKAAR